MSRCKTCKENTVWDVLKCTVDQDGRHHSVSGRPSIVFRRTANTKRLYRIWQKRGLYHRENGAAVISTDGTTEYKEYFIEDKRVAK